MLRGIGMNETADKIVSDPSILVEEEFNITKTRVEYANRVVGVIIGIMISLVLLRSFKFWKEERLIFYAAFVAWLSVVFTGWFGSIVVSTNLTPWTVSVHLGFAFLIIGLLTYTTVKTSSKYRFHNFSQSWLLWLCMGLLLVQLFLGVQVREVLDNIAHTFPTDRNSWISRLGGEFIVHRSFSWLLLLANGFLAYQMAKNSLPKALWAGLVGLTLASVLTGTVMTYAAVPASIQPLHLLISALNFGLLVGVILMTRSAKEKQAL